MKRVGVYIRVSTQEQAQEGYSIPFQREKLKAYCLAHDYIIVDEYIDPGATGANLDRPAMQKLIEDVKSGMLDRVVVYKLDRLSRSQKDTLYLIEDIFLKNNVDLISMQESFDTSSPFGRAMVGILSVFAQLERESIKERTDMGRRERAKEGLHHGGRMDPIGYDYIDGKLVINEYEAAQVRLIYNLFIEGKSMASIAKYMREAGFRHKYSNYRNTRTIANILSRAVYVGLTKHRDEYFKGQHEPIISEEVWNKAQEMRRRIRENQVKRSPSNDTLLKDILFCDHCGSKFARRYTGKNRIYYECYSRYRHPEKDPCKNLIWKVKDLDEIISEQILKLAHDPSIIANLTTKESENELKAETLKKEISKLDKQISRLLDLYQDETIPVSEVSNRVKQLYDKKKSLTIMLEETNKKDRPINGGQELLNILSDIKSTWNTATMEEKRAIVQQLIKRVWVDWDDIRIEWNFA